MAIHRPQLLPAGTARLTLTAPERAALSCGVALALFVLSVSGCRTIEGTYGVPPFYEEYPSPSSPEAATGREVYYRPLFSYERSLPLGVPRDEVAPELERTRVRSLPPVVDVSLEHNQHRVQLLPLFFHRQRRGPEGADSDWMLLPFFFWGHEPGAGSYFAFFPVGGQLRGLLGQDKIHFALFPIYWKSENESKHSLHVLWPFVNTVWGRNWEGWRAWPFYGRYSTQTQDGEPRSRQRFVLWPFYIEREDRLHDSPQQTFFTFPFYGHRLGERSETRTYLWPFYQVHEDLRTGQTTHMGYVIPYRFTDNHYDLWPFFGVKQLEEPGPIGDGATARRRYRHFFLWPIERYDWFADGNQETTRFWLLPLLWHFYYIDTDTLATEEKWKVWPFWYYKRRGDDVSFDLFSPLWFDAEPYQRHYARWFSIFRYRWTQDLSGWEVLYGAVMFRRDATRRESVFSLLGGLLECGRQDGGVTLKLLYIPLW